GHRSGLAIIQTYAPDSPLIHSIITRDWGEFYNKELDERRQFLFPPFCYLLKLTCKRASDPSAQAAAQRLAADIRSRYSGIVVDGPTPSFHGKVQSKFIWQLVVKAKQRRQLV